MLQDKNRTFDIDGNDLSAFREDGFLTPDQYNSSLEYSFLFTFLISFLQMNNVPRADSPRNGPMRSSLGFNRPNKISTKVVLPAPEGPTMPAKSPLPILKDTSRSTSSRPSG